MKITDTIIVGAVVILFAFPMMFLIMLLGTGKAKLVFDGDLSRAIEVATQTMQQENSRERDSMIVANSYAFEANVEEGARVSAEKDQLVKEQERLELLKQELQAEREKLEAERQKMEQTVGAGEVEKAERAAAATRRVTELARVYQAMKPKEAAQILETLSDNLCVQVLKAMTDDRQKAKILAAMEMEKASNISRKM